MFVEPGECISIIAPCQWSLQTSVPQSCVIRCLFFRKLLSSGSSHVNQPSSVRASSSLPVTQPQGLMGHRVQRTSGNSPLHSKQTVRTLLGNKRCLAPTSAPIVPHHTVPVDPSPRPSHILCQPYQTQQRAKTPCRL
jgi:hypothetical protein